jgi:RNA polymerase sigma-70 factor (ECF subfamily)
VNSSANFDYLQYITDTVDSKAIIRDLMAAYGNDVWNYAFTVSRSAEQADDITQQVFVKAYSSLRSYCGETSVKTWLLAMTRDTACQSRKTSLLRKVPLWFRKRDGGNAEQPEMNASWKKVISLPAKYREALILSAHHRLSLKDIAYVLRLSEDKAKALLHQARLKAIQEKGE